MPSNQADFLYLNIMENYSLVTGASSGIGWNETEMYSEMKNHFNEKYQGYANYEDYITGWAKSVNIWKTLILILERLKLSF